MFFTGQPKTVRRNKSDVQSNCYISDKGLIWVKNYNEKSYIPGTLINKLGLVLKTQYYGNQKNRTEVHYLDFNRGWDYLDNVNWEKFQSGEKVELEF